MLQHELNKGVMNGVENLNVDNKLTAGLHTQSFDTRGGFMKRIKAIPRRIKEFFAKLSDDLKRLYTRLTDRFRTIDHDTEIAKKIYGDDFFTELSEKFKKKIRRWSDVTDEHVEEYMVMAFQPYYSVVFDCLIKPTCQTPQIDIIAIVFLNLET